LIMTASAKAFVHNAILQKLPPAQTSFRRRSRIYLRHPAEMTLKHTPGVNRGTGHLVSEAMW
jgi:hypothetical protein